MTALAWEQKVQAKQAEAAAKIPSEWKLSADILESVSNGSIDNVLDIPGKSGILTDREIEITEQHDATSLLQKLAFREYTSLEVTTAFCKRAAIAQQLTFCLTETFFDIAIERAKQADAHLAATGKTLGPLHGLPISIKDSVNVAGIPTTLGFTSFLELPPKSENAAIVDILLSAGAVLYVKTNIPQTMMTADSHNNVFGRTLNPFRLSLTAGGSTGGEGALLAMRGSVLGVGTDVAGSIRIPSICCGLFGFKPTAGRIPHAGIASSGRAGIAGGVATCAGPLCHSVRDADLFFKVVCASKIEDIDDTAVGFPWMEVEKKDILTIGVLPEDPLFPVHPPIQRALEEAVAKLSAAGHKIVHLSSDLSLSEANKVAFGLLAMDPDQTPLQNILKSGEPIIPSIGPISEFAKEAGTPELRKLYDYNIEKNNITAQTRKIFVDNKLDVVLAPGFVSTAVPHDKYNNAVYTVFANLINYPACVIPFGSADKAGDAKYLRDTTYSPEYQPDAIEGAPCHIQLIGRRFKDENLMFNAQVVENALLK